MRTQAGNLVLDNWPVDWPFEPFPEAALDGSISDRFEAVAARYAERLAVCDNTRSLTYAELASLVGRIVAAITGATADRPGQVAILLRNEVRYSAAMLGVLASGRAFVPLDADHPPERNRLIAAHAGAVAVISAGDLAANARTFFSHDVRVLDLETIKDGPTDRLADQARSLFAHQPVIDIEAPTGCELRAKTPPARPDDVAVILYTSGSTGLPKGVYQNHRGVLYDILEAVNSHRISSEDRLALFYSPTVISGFRIALSALLVGAQLHILSPRELGGIKLVRELHKRHITIFRSVPALFRHVVESLEGNERLDSIRLVVLGGDRVDWSDFDAFRRNCPPNANFGVHLGATECWTLYLEWSVNEYSRTTNGKLPVGRVIDGQTVTLVGEGGQTVADGEVGEFIVSSRHLALGYWRDPELTARVFSTCGLDPKRRTYSTGDLGVRRSDGLFEYVGRRDQQIKLHGQRIEPGEVESALRSCAGVGDAAVLVRRDEANVPQSLVAYVEGHLGVGDVAPATLTSMLAQRLPAYMVPAVMVLVDKLPRLANMKIDRMRLDQMDGSRMTRMLDPVADPFVNEVAQIFKLVLGAGSAAPEDSVASLGGDSLQIVRIAIELEKHFGVAISSKFFNASQTIRVVARWVSREKAKQTSTVLCTLPTPDAFASRSPPVRVLRHAPLPLSLLQEHFWVPSQPHQTVVGRDRIVGPLNVSVLRQCMTYLAGRHEMLRTSLATLDGHPMQIVNAPAPVAMTYIDFADAPDAEHRAMLLFKQEAGSVVGVMQPAPLRFALIRICANEHWLMRIGHHILFDGLSWNLYFDELALLYEAKALGKAPPLPECEPLQYVDYAAWERQALRGPAYQQRIKWWENLFRQNAPALQLPFLRVEPLEGINPEEGFFPLRIDSQVSQGLAKLARQEGVTYFTVVLGAYVALLSAESGVADVVLGTYASTRDRAELQKVFGMFVNLVPIILRCETSNTFRKWLYSVRDRMLAIRANSLPYEQLQREMQARHIRMPEIRAVIHAPVPRPVCRFVGLEIASFPVESTEIMPWGFQLIVGKTGEESHLRFDATVYDPDGARNLINRFGWFLNAVSQNPDLTIDRLLEISKKKPNSVEHEHRPSP